MNGIFKDDAERDKTIIELYNNSKLIVDKLDGIEKHIMNHEVRLRETERVIEQHKVWVYIISSVTVGIMICFVNMVLRR